MTKYVFLINHNISETILISLSVALLSFSVPHPLLSLLGITQRAKAKAASPNSWAQYT